MPRDVVPAPRPPALAAVLLLLLLLLPTSTLLLLLLLLLLLPLVILSWVLTTLALGRRVVAAGASEVTVLIGVMAPLVAPLVLQLDLHLDLGLPVLAGAVLALHQVPAPVLELLHKNMCSKFKLKVKTIKLNQSIKGALFHFAY